MAPLVFFTMIFMAFAPSTRCENQPFKSFIQHAGKKFLVSLVAALCLTFYFAQGFSGTVMLTFSLSFWVLLSILPFYRLLPGMAIAHAGFAILIIGIMLASLLSQEKAVRMKPGDVTTIGPYQFLFIDTTGIQGSNYRGIQASFEVTKNQRHIVNLYPEKRIYTVRDMVMTKVDIDPSIFRDLYIALGEPLNDNDWTIRIYYKPFIRWIWAGGLLMLLGGVLALRRQPLKRLPR